MVKSAGFKIWQAWLTILDSDLGDLCSFNCYELQFPHLYNGNSNRTHSQSFLWVSACRCTEVPQTQWLKTTHMYSLIRSQKSEDGSKLKVSAELCSLWMLWWKICSSDFSASRDCLHSLVYVLSQLQSQESSIFHPLWPWPSCFPLIRPLWLSRPS